MTRRVMLFSILVLSLASNAFLLYRGGQRQSSQAVASEKPRVSARQQRLLLSKLARLARLDQSELVVRLARAEARLEELIPLPERYSRLQRSAESESRFLPFVRKVFPETADQAEMFDMQCRQRICRLSGDRQDVDWQDRVQHIQSAVPGLIVSSVMIEDEMYFELEHSVRQSAIQWANTVGVLFRGDAQYDTCKEMDPRAGTTVMKFALDPASHIVKIEVVGSQGEDVRCFHRLLERIVLNTPLPTEVTVLPDSVSSIEIEM